MKSSAVIFVFAMILVTAVSVASMGQTQGHIYLVTGLRIPDVGFRVSNAVFKVDEERRQAVPITNIAEAKQGSDFIIADHQRRLIVAGSPSGKPTELRVLSMDSPDAVHRLSVSLDGTLLDAFFLQRNEGGATLAFQTAKNNGRGRVDELLTGVDLSPDGTGTAQRQLSWQDYKFLRTEGWWSPSDEIGRLGSFRLTAQDGKAMTSRGGVLVDMNIPFPGSFEAEKDQTFLLDVINDEMLVIDRSNERGTGTRGPIGTTTLSIYDKKSGSWQQNVVFPGGGSSVRGFGPWVAVNEAATKVDLTKAGTLERTDPEAQSPGAVLRNRVLNPHDRDSDQATIDDLFKRGLYYFPGAMHLYDIRSKKKFVINTGIGDSEVLLIEGSKVYYRVDDTLFRAQIGNNDVQNAIELLRDENVQVAHWAFLGP